MIFEIIAEYAYPQRADRHTLSGVTTLNDIHAKKRIVVHDKKTHIAVASTWSNPNTGEWRISHINEYPENSLYVTVFDGSGTVNAEIFDFVSQVSNT